MCHFINSRKVVCPKNGETGKWRMTQNKVKKEVKEVVVLYCYGTIDQNSYYCFHFLQYITKCLQFSFLVKTTQSQWN